MTNPKPLIVVDDDIDDQEMMSLALQDLGIRNEVKMFRDAESALSYLHNSEESPFLIISDVNMPKVDGLEFKEQIESCNDLKARKIPFVFLSTAASDGFIKKAYDVCAQGFFEKGTSFSQLKDALGTILKYWQKSKYVN